MRTPAARLVSQLNKGAATAVSIFASGLTVSLMMGLGDARDWIADTDDVGALP
jgi:glutamate/tyrosine decarboxylase-like PLP-dependent enzyme